MRKPKLYIDTSVISHLDAADTPEKMNDTIFFWEELKQDKYQVIISNVTIAEITKCNEPKRTFLFQKLNEIDYEIFEENDETRSLTEQYLQYGVLGKKSEVDLRHISVASVSNCNYIISWNFKHFVNIKTIEKVQSANKLLQYKEINIVPPSMLTGGNEDE
jgi:hypothetical protein